MDHSYFKDRISAYHDRDLPPYELQAVEEHLRECAECQVLLAEFEKLERMVAEKSELADADYWEQSAQKIEKTLGFEGMAEVVDIRPKSWRGLGWKIAAVAASLAVVTFIGLHEGDIFKDKAVPVPSNQSDSVPPKVQKFTAPPKEKMESATDSARPPVRTDETKNAKTSGTPVQSPEVVVPEKAGTSVKSTEADALRETGKKGLREISPDLSQTKPVAMRDLAGRQPAADSEAPMPSADEAKGSYAQSQPPVAEMMLSKEKVDRSPALVEAVDMDAAGESELPALRQQRDSLMALYQATYGADTAGRVESMALTTDKRLKVAKAAAPDSTASLFERQLIDVHFRIAQISEDAGEREASVRFLKAYADRTDVRFADRARQHIESIQSAGG